VLHGRYTIYTPFEDENHLSRRITGKPMRDALGKMLEQLEGIDAVSVRLIRAEEGEHLKAFVATNAAEAEYKALKARIDQFCEQHLKPVERPKAITFGRKLPKSGLGKIIDWPMDQNTFQ